MANRPGIDLALRAAIRPGDEREKIACGQLVPDRQPLTSDQQIEHDQMDVLADQGPALGLILPVALAQLVRWREDLDGRDEIAVGPMADLDPEVAHLLDFLDRQIDRDRLEREHAHIGEDRPALGLSPLYEAKLLAEASLIAFGQNIIEGVTAVGREAGMKIRPVSLALEIRIDSRKWAGHRGPSFRILGLPLNPVYRPESRPTSPMARRLSSCALRPRLMSPADQRTVFDAEEGTRPEVGSRGLADLASGDLGDPLGPVLRLVEAQAKALQLQQPFGALIDGLELEDVGAGQVAAGAVHLVVAECPVVHGPDLPGDRRHHAVGLLGHRP